MLLLSQESLQKYLSELCSCQALEVHSDHENVLIPYMMNDALECYLLFTDAQLTGRPIPAFEGDTSFECICETSGNSPKNGIIFRQGSQNVFTLWYASVCQKLHCYRYDQIGHFWVSGQEHWRRLVYILGTVYDKYQYMGDQVCNPQETELLKLMEFAPFYQYSPIHEPLDDIYPDTAEGLQTMIALAAQAKDSSFLLLLGLYRILPFSWFRTMVSHALNRPRRIPLYELLYQKIEKASGSYPERDYGSERNRQIAEARKDLSDRLLKQGFLGNYPLFQKGNLQILAMEEHPFTILEANDFQFRIQLMVSETAGHCPGRNAGFFSKKGNRCRIMSVKDYFAT